MAKFAHIVVILMSAECLVTSVAFALAGQYKQAAYWLLASGINAVAGSF